MEQINRKTSNSRVNQGLLTDVSWIFLSRSFCTKSMTRESSAKSSIRAWKVMEMCYEILVQEKRVTQRELFYKLLCASPDYFSSQLQVNQTIQDVVALLRCSRFSLGIMASSRGAVAGRLLLQEPGEEIIDGSSGYPISGDLDLLEKLIMKTDARYIFVIEKLDTGIVDMKANTIELEGAPKIVHTDRIPGASTALYTFVMDCGITWEAASTLLSEK